MRHASPPNDLMVLLATAAAVLAAAIGAFAPHLN